MARLIWTPPALKDVQRLYRFLASKHPQAAKRAVGTIRTSTNLLKRQPEAGRPVEELGPGFHEWLIPFGQSGYVALYHLGSDATVAILAVRHQREAGY